MSSWTALTSISGFRQYFKTKFYIQGKNCDSLQLFSENKLYYICSSFNFLMLCIKLKLIIFCCKIYLPCFILLFTLHVHCTIQLYTTMFVFDRFLCTLCTVVLYILCKQKYQAGWIYVTTENNIIFNLFKIKEN